MILAVDFDGTVVEHRFPEIGQEIPGAIRTIQDLHEAGHKILIWTCRTLARPAPGIEEMIAWLKRTDGPYDAMNYNMFGASFYSMPIVYGDVYLDDKNFGGFHGWDEVRKQFLGKEK